MNSPIILITTANVPPGGVPFLEMTNVATRLLTAKAAVFFWAAQGVGGIVIADATGVKLLNEDEVILLKQMNVEVEQISTHQNNKEIILKGKGYGEGRLIQFALEKSLLLKNAKIFFKCTGKVYCRNFEMIYQMIKSNNIKNIFWRHLGDGDSTQPWADMRFFYSSIDFCVKNIIPAYLMSDDSKAAAEYYCFSKLNEILPSAKSLRPMLSGFSGGTGKQYFDLSLGALDLAYPCWVEA